MSLMLLQFPLNIASFPQTSFFPHHPFSPNEASSETPQQRQAPLQRSTSVRDSDTPPSLRVRHRHPFFGPPEEAADRTSPCPAACPACPAPLGSRKRVAVAGDGDCGSGGGG